ncbi:MAG: DUF4918 family protein [Spirosomataceae bacterium]
MKSFADKVIAFNRLLDFKGKLPEGIRLMNPFRENTAVLSVSSAFYQKYYNDFQKRHLILGINPGRFGGGVTGVPFTDPKRLQEKCGIPFPGPLTHEPSSVFVYNVIDAFGGPTAFYSQFYIHSICPLGFTNATAQGKEINYNYYDSKALTEAVYEFMVDSLRKQLAFGIHTDVCFCFGTGKNETFLRQLNDRYRFFKRITALEHPRFVMQYKAKSKQVYIDKYLTAFAQAVPS